MNRSDQPFGGENAMIHRRSSCIAIISLALTGCLVAVVQAQGTYETRPMTPMAIVTAALQAEADGNMDRRDELLAYAVQRYPAYAPAHWHRGEVKLYGKWTRLEAARDVIGSDRLYQYRQFRDGKGDSIADQLTVANWCRDHGLKPQERAHLVQVLQQDSGHYQARTRLGFRLIDGRWRLRSQLQKDAAVAKDERKALGRYREDLDTWAGQMHLEDPRLQENGRTSIVAIKDPAAIPAMEDRLALHSVPVALAAVQAIGNMPQYEASVALARQAVFSPSAEVREHAATYLKSKKPESYVPAMLAALSSPVTAQFEVTRTGDGEIRYRHTYEREVQGTKQLLITDKSYRRENRGGDAQTATNRAQNRVQQEVRRREAEVEEQNAYTLELNSRICQTLNTALDLSLPDDPDVWWTWWNAYNEVYVAGEKPTESLYESDYISVSDLPPPQRSYDCLAAGTLVTTLDGLRAVDKLQMGDLVLSQDPETGELAYKAVVETTVRPSGQTIRVHFDGQSIETSGGHLFWISGRGWVKTRDLVVGMQLHTPQGTIQIERLEDATIQETYNLVVDEFHTFFVGAKRILNHDNTVSSPTNSLVPGLSVGTARTTP